MFYSKKLRKMHQLYSGITKENDSEGHHRGFFSKCALYFDSSLL